MTESGPIIVYGGPESIFRVEDVSVEAGIARGSMPLGPWLTGPDGRLAPGAIGVFIDDILGYASVVPVAPERWSISTDITLDVFPTLQLPTTRLHGEAEAVHVDDVGCFAMGKVYNDDNVLVAVCSQRGRYLSRTWSETDAVTKPSEPPVGIASVSGLLGVNSSDHVVQFTAAEVLQNPMGILHGGVSLCASDLAATLALAGGPALETTSIRMVYVRPVPPDALVEYSPTVEHRGRSLGLVEVVGTVNGKACTRAQITAHPA